MTLQRASVELDHGDLKAIAVHRRWRRLGADPRSATGIAALAGDKGLAGGEPAQTRGL